MVSEKGLYGLKKCPERLHDMGMDSCQASVCPIPSSCPILIQVLPVVKGRVLAGLSELGRTRAWLAGSGVGSEAGAAGDD